MSFKSRYQQRKFTANTKGFEYVSLHDLFEQYGGAHVFPLCAIYINERGKYGAAPVLATDSCYVNLPSHLCEVCRQMIADPETVDLINAGKAGFSIYTYETNNRLCYSVNWEDR